jgi:hypothetical protein
MRAGALRDAAGAPQAPTACGARWGSPNLETDKKFDRDRFAGSDLEVIFEV